MTEKLSPLPAPAPITLPANAKRTALEARARDTAEQYEAVFIYQLLENMSSGLKTDGPFGGGEAEATWRSQLNDAYAKVIAQRGGIGIADALYKEMLRLQEAGK